MAFEEKASFFSYSWGFCLNNIRNQHKANSKHVLTTIPIFFKQKPNGMTQPQIKPKWTTKYKKEEKKPKVKAKETQWGAEKLEYDKVKRKEKT